ncbi:MerR family transcriptional regulator [Oricola sp.]|uniref:MerR family transcriptional regulator n=1 Tax=Oricola sp. TaxID=1979950 RepID=UPI003BAA5094
MNTIPINTSQQAREATFRIGELAKEFDITLRALRFYEDKGLLRPRRMGNTRLYSRGDRARLKLILLGKRVGLSLHDVREMLELYDPHGDNMRQLNAAQAKGEEQLVNLHEQRDDIDAAIAELESTLVIIREKITERG